MSDEQRDDEILGRALARAVETQPVAETPYERSRLAVRPLRRGLSLWPALAVAAALLVAVSFGSWLRRPLDAPPVAASPAPTSSSTRPTTTGAPASEVPGTGPLTRVFFVRDLLPPVSGSVSARPATGGAGDPRAANISARVAALWDAPASSAPTGTSNLVASIGRGGAGGGLGVAVSIAGDTATVDIDPMSGWNVRGAARVQALVQQLVYTVTEEPGIRRARILEKGRTPVIDGMTLDRVLTREDVSDYGEPGSTVTAAGHGDPGNSTTTTIRATVDAVAPALARIVVESDLRGGPVHYPDFTVRVVPNDDLANPQGGKWRLIVSTNTTDPKVGTVEVVDRSPLRSIAVTAPKCVGCVGTIYEIGLDDLRPWRTAVAWDPFRIIVDVGGDPRTIIGSNAVYGPVYDGVVGRSFEVTGVAHNFEASVDIRVKDDRQNVLLRTHTTASLCCDPGGTFTGRVDLPAGVRGRIYLEVYEESAKDGSDGKVIRIPLTVP